jgi:hypothetical protein
LVYDVICAVERVLYPAGKLPQSSNTDEVEYAVVMIDLIALGLTGIYMASEHEKLAKISFYDESKCQ